MKRLRTKKIKACSACAEGNQTLTMKLMLQPQVKKRLRSSVAMVSLVILMGTPNLLLTQESDRVPAAELADKQLISHTPAVTEAAIIPRQNSVQEVVKSLPQSESASHHRLTTPQLEPTASLNTEAAITDRLPEPLNQLAEEFQENAVVSPQFSPAQTLLVAIATPQPEPSAISNIPQTREVVKSARENQLIQKLKASKTPEIVSQSHKEVAQSNTAPVTTALQPLQAEKVPGVTSEANTSLKIKQRFLINRLKENLAKSSLATSNLSAPSERIVKPNYAAAKKLKVNQANLAPQQVTQRSQTATENNFLDRQTAIVIPDAETRNLVSQPSNPQQQVELSPEVTLEEKVGAKQELQATPAPVFVIPEVTAAEQNSLPELQTEDRQEVNKISTLPSLQPSVVTKTALIVPDNSVTKLDKVEKSGLTDYQVKRGDTLTAIARTYNVSLSELVKINQFSDPNLIRITQQIKIPITQHNTTAKQTNLEYTGMGGSISDQAEELVAPPLVKVEATAIEPKLESNLATHSLQTDLQKLKQKYSADSTSNQAVPAVNTLITSLPVTSSIPKENSSPVANTKLEPQLADEPVNPEFRPTLESQNWQPTGQKQYKSNIGATAASKSRVTKTAINVDASESLQSFRGRQVSPELPPLGAGDTYLPKPNLSPYKNFIWPTKGALTSGYGWRWGRMHRGIDIAAPIGTPIMAAAPGVVERAGWNSGGYGKLVDIRHADGTLTRYAHNNRILVQAGQFVDQGQRISEMGNTGFSTGPHLHFEVHPAGKKGAVNPIALLPRR